MSHPEDPIPQSVTESAEQPRSFYEPLTTVEETTVKLEGMLAKPPEEISDEDIFEAIADTFVARCNQYKEAGNKYEEGDEVDWQKADEVYFPLDTGKGAHIGYSRDEVEEAWFDDVSDDPPISITVREGAIYVTFDDFNTVDASESAVRPLNSEEKEHILNTVLEGLKSPLETP